MGKKTDKLYKYMIRTKKKIKSLAKKYLLKAIIFLTVIFLCGIFCLEILSRQKCAKFIDYAESPCFDLMTIYDKNLTFEDLINAAINKKYEKPPEKISNQDIERVINEKTIFVSQSQVKANGRSCILFNVVSLDLPHKSKRYVAIHEAIHYLGERNETKTNYMAAIKEPIGFIQTIIYSVYLGLKPVSISNYPCRLGGLWNIFKIYFLNIE